MTRAAQDPKRAVCGSSKEIETMADSVAVAVTAGFAGEVGIAAAERRTSKGRVGWAHSHRVDMDLAALKTGVRRTV